MVNAKEIDTNVIHLTLSLSTVAWQLAAISGNTVMDLRRIRDNDVSSSKNQVDNK